MKKRVLKDWSDLGRYEGVLVEEIERLESHLEDVADAVDGPRLLMAEKYREMIKNRLDLLNMIRARDVEVVVNGLESVA